MPKVNTAVSYLPLALAVYSGAISLTSIIMRASVGNGFLGALATYGLAATSDIISVHTPGIFDILFYSQFMLMTGQMSINYPSFYQTFTALFHWSFLEFRNSFAGKGPENSTYVLIYGGAGSVNQGKSSPAEANNFSLRKRMALPLDGVDYEWSLPHASSRPVYATKTTRQELTGTKPTQRYVIISEMTISFHEGSLIAMLLVLQKTRSSFDYQPPSISRPVAKHIIVYFKLSIYFIQF